MGSTVGSAGVAADGTVPASGWVRVMADYSSDGLWEEDGCMMCMEDLPVPAELAARLEAWCQRYEDAQLWKDPGERGGEPFDLAAFSEEGLLVARAIKDALPGWTVFYFDEAAAEAAERGGDRAAFEYEIRAAVP